MNREITDLKVLIAEDEAKYFEDLKSYLCSEFGFAANNIMHAISARDAIMVMSQYPYDVIITDGQMESARNDGLEIMRYLHRQKDIKSNIETTVTIFNSGNSRLVEDAQMLSVTHGLPDITANKPSGSRRANIFTALKHFLPRLLKTKCGVDILAPR